MQGDGLLTEERLRAALGTRAFRFEQRTGSTNDIARQWALDGAPAGSVVVAEEQLAGRGRLGRAWTAPAGTALLFTVIMRPQVDPERLPRLTMVGAVSTAEVLSALAPGSVNLKWPNDVLLTGRKVAGILPEVIWQGERLEAAVLGIGINVRVDFAGTPLEDRATSVETVTANVIDRAGLLNDVLRRVDYWSARLDDSTLVDAWSSRLSTLGQHVTASSVNGVITGFASGVDESGALLVQSDDGIIHRIMAGEVTLTHT